MSRPHAILFPRAFAFAIDDLGWNEGSDLSAQNPPGPFRAGVKRNFDLADYLHIVTVAKAVGARIQSLFILSEMDRTNVLAKYPTTTWMGSNWNNAHRANDHQHEIMNYVIGASAWMEFGLHGTGHEYWAGDGIQRRAEWYNLTDHAPWPEESVRGHIDAFREIMSQYGISPEHGHSFPESFVPCAYSYYWNPDGHYSLGKLLTEAGVKYANTDFSQIPECRPPKEINGGGFDFGTHVINRLNYGNPWYQLDCLPEVLPEFQETDIIESHWPNWLAQDDMLQHTVAHKWIAYYRTIQSLPRRYIAKNTEQLHAQWLYNQYTTLHESSPGYVTIDNTRMPEAGWCPDQLGNLVLKMKLKPGEHVNSAHLGTDQIPGYFEESGFGFLYLPPLKKEIYQLIYSIGADPLSPCVWNDGTYNIYSIEAGEERLTLELKMYGDQIVKIRCERPLEVVARQGVLIASWAYNSTERITEVKVKAPDMQGSRGKIVLTF